MTQRAQPIRTNGPETNTPNRPRRPVTMAFRRLSGVWPVLLTLLFLIGILSGALSGAATAHAAEPPALVVNDEVLESDVPPRIVESRTLVPIRIISEALGATVHWDAAQKRVLIDGPRGRIALTIGQVEALIAEEAMTLDVAPQIFGGRTFVPLRFVAEALGADVHWDDPTRTVIVTLRQGRLTELTIDPEGPRASLRLALTAPVAYRVEEREPTASQPRRLVIVLEQTEIELAERRVEVGIGGIVRAFVETSDEEPDAALIVLELSDDVDVSVRRDPNRRDLILDITSQITAVRYETLADGQALVIEANGPIAPEAFILDDPSRLVIDVAPARASRMVARELDGDPLVERVRISQFDEETVRIVADLARPVTYTVEQEARRVAIYPHQRVERVQAVVADGRLQLEVHGETALGHRIDVTDDTFDIVIPYATYEGPTEPETVPGIDVLKVKQVEGDDAPAVHIRAVAPGQQGYQALQASEFGPLLIRFARSILAGKTIVIDPGHGGSDPGTIGHGGTFEKDVIMAIAQQVVRLLRDAGATVLMTREDDVRIDLYVRAEMANRAGADVFVSIHLNAFTNPELAGTETYYHPSSQAGYRLALALHQALIAELGRPNRGIRSADFVVLRETAMPAALLEILYLSNPEEEKLINDPAVQQRVAKAIVEGLANYFQTR